MARRMRETRKNRMPHGLGKTGSNAVNIPNATHNKIFQNGDRMPGKENKASVMEAHSDALVALL